MNDDSTMKTASEVPQHDWSRFDDMTAAERHAAASRDPDARPLTPDDMKRMKRTPRVRVIRRALKLSQEEFAARFRIPPGTLRDWERAARTSTPRRAPTCWSSAATRRR